MRQWKTAKYMGLVEVVYTRIVNNQTILRDKMLEADIYLILYSSNACDKYNPCRFAE